MEGYPLNPIAIAIGPFEVHWYGLIIGFGIALGFYLAAKEGDRLGLPKDTFADLLIWAIPIAIISAAWPSGFSSRPVSRLRSSQWCKRSRIRRTTG